MMNFGYLGVIFMNVFNPIIENNKDFKSNLLKCGASILGVFLFAYILIKIYEVPIYVTKIKSVCINSQINPSGGLNIRIVRDYDRSDKGLAMLDSPEKSSRAKQNRTLGGIFITGKFNYKNGCQSDNGKICNSIRSVVKDKMREYGKEEIENPQIVYISALTSHRQNFGIHYNLEGEQHDSVKHGEMEYSYFNGKRQVCKRYQYDDYFWYRNYKNVSGGDGKLYEEYYVASNTDNEVNIDFTCQAYTFTKPNVIRSLEDISKIVEIVEIGYSYLDSTKYAGTWALVDSLEIDYVGPAEFSEAIDPQPDKKTLSSIIYTDKDKIRQIGLNGLKYHVNFPDMENIQEAKIFIVSSLLTGLTALFFKYFYFIIRDIWHSFSYKKEKRLYVTIGLLVILIILIILLLLKPSNISVLNIRQ